MIPIRTAYFIGVGGIGMSAVARDISIITVWPFLAMIVMIHRSSES